MAWNEPGGGNKDPWRGKGPDQRPPDLDEVVRKLQERLGGLFGGKGRRGSGKSDGDGGSPGSGGSISGKVALLGAVVLFVIWLASGIYIVGPAERGVVLRFSAYTEVTAPGPHWRIPYPVDEVHKVNVDEISSFTHKAAMLTKDENIVDVELTVQSRIQDAADFLFQDQSPKKTLRDVTETVVRKTIGGSRLDFILTEGRSAVSATIRERAQDLVNQYKSGLEITSVNMQPAKPPEQVKAAFDDAIKAREDKERLENKAEAYANEILPQARGGAARVQADARAYRDKVVAGAEGETSRFLAILNEYEKAPQVTRERLYLETMEQVLGESNKVLLDVKEGNSLMYLPLNHLLNAGNRRDQARELKDLVSAADQEPKSTSQRKVVRERRSRR